MKTTFLLFFIFLTMFIGGMLTDESWSLIISMIGGFGTGWTLVDVMKHLKN